MRKFREVRPLRPLVALLCSLAPIAGEAKAAQPSRPVAVASPAAPAKPGASLPAAAAAKPATSAPAPKPNLTRLAFVHVVKGDVSCEEVAARLYGDPSLGAKIAAWNHLAPNTPLANGTRLQVESSPRLSAVEGERSVQRYRRAKIAATSGAGNEFKPSYFNAGLGLTHIAYTETGISDYSSISLTAKASFLRPIGSSRWDVGASTFVTVVPITHNLDAKVRFFGMNLRAGYSPGWPGEPWRLSILGGAYYSTMMVSGAKFGFHHLGGPQLYPTLRRMFGKGHSGTIYLKFSPINDGIKVLALTNRELAAGLIYSRAFRNGHPLGISFDVASMYLNFSGVVITSRTFTLGASYGF